MSKIKITVKSKRFPYIRGGVRFENGQEVEAEVTQAQLKALENDKHIIIKEGKKKVEGAKAANGVGVAQKNSGYETAEHLAAAIYAIWNSFEDKDFKKDGGLKINAVRDALQNELIEVELLDEAMPLVFEKLEADLENSAEAQKESE